MPSEPLPPLLVLLGPTAVGKTALAVRLGQAFNGEIISADSRQIYRGMDIGTAKPTPAEQAAVPHHLLDVRDPDEVMTLSQFQAAAYARIDSLHARGKLPLLVGGTGQWVRAVVEGWGIPEVPPDEALRRDLAARAEAEGHQTLHAELARVDPQAAAKIDARNVRRVVRALEVYYKSGIPITTHQEKKPPPYDILQIGLTRSREALYARVDRRIDRMMAAGLLAEVEALRAAGHGWQQPAMLGLGYRQLGLYLRGEAPLDEAVYLIKKETRRFVRHQANWFRRGAEQVLWVDMAPGLKAVYPVVTAQVRQWLGPQAENPLAQVPVVEG